MTKDRIKVTSSNLFDQSDTMKWKNTSDESVPAWGCVKLDVYNTADRYFDAIKPDGSGNLHFLNGPSPVAPGAFGGSQLWNQSRLGLTTSSIFGATVGPVADSWQMEESGSGFVIFSDPTDGKAAILQVGGGVGGIKLYHGIILRQCSEACSTYEVQLVHRYLQADCKDCY